MIDLPFSALDLKYPLTVEAQGPRQVGNEVAPRWLLVRGRLPGRAACLR